MRSLADGLSLKSATARIQVTSATFPPMLTGRRKYVLLGRVRRDECKINF